MRFELTFAESLKLNDGFFGEDIAVKIEESLFQGLVQVAGQVRFGLSNKGRHVSSRVQGYLPSYMERVVGRERRSDQVCTF